MDNDNYDSTMSEFNNNDPDHKVRMFRDFDPEGTGNVPDPYYSGGFDNVYKFVRRTCENMIELAKNG